MFIKDQIALIDEQINEQIPKECDKVTNKWNVKYHGLCRVMWNQNDGVEKKHGYLLHETDSLMNKVTIDDYYDVQIMHVAQEIPEVFGINYGGFRDSTYDYRMKLLCVTTKRSMFERCLEAMRNTEDVVFRYSNFDTEQVMRNEIKIVVGQDKNYPPHYWAFAIYYGVSSIEPMIEDEEESEEDVTPLIGAWRVKTTDDGLITEKYTSEGWIEKDRLV